MRAILSSLLGGSSKVNGARVPAPIFEANGLAELLREMWVRDARVLLVAADPQDRGKNDALRDCFRQALPMSGLSVSSVEVCDGRNPEIVGTLGQTDVLILTGGHVPTQNRFLKALGLRERLADFRGLLLAWSAGAMNCARHVYAGPELEGEAVDPGYERWLEGLGITGLNLFPHYQALRDTTLDGLRMMEDITLPDSLGHEFIALNDGSFVLIDGPRETLYGQAYRIRDGEVSRLCGDNETVKLH